MQNEFRENLAFLEQGGLVQRLAGEGQGVIHVSPEKRLTLDFYKNNTIHFFLLPALLTEALSRGLDGGRLKDDVAWWLDLLRWEFPLPEREEIPRELGDLMGYLTKTGALDGAGAGALVLDHPFVASVIGILDNFREAYWVAAQELMTLTEAAVAEKAIVDRMQKRYKTGLLLGEVRRPEGNSSVTLGNALHRYAEIGCLLSVPGKGRERLLTRGPLFDELIPIAERVSWRLLVS